MSDDQSARDEKPESYTTPECSSVGPEHRAWDAEVAGSNPATQTTEIGPHGSALLAAQNSEPTSTTAREPADSAPQRTPDPRYWMYETSGVLRPAIEAYFSGLMTDQHIAAMRAYLRQWIAGPWASNRLDDLRADIEGLTSPQAIRAWLRIVESEGIDPL